MFGIFKKKARKAIVEVKKMENRDAVEATEENRSGSAITA